MPRSVLIVEDDVLVALDIESALEDEGFDVVGVCSDVDCAIRTIEQQQPDCVTLDVDLSYASSAPIADRLAALDIPFIYVTGRSKREDWAGKANARDIIQKPFRSERLAGALRDL